MKYQVTLFCSDGKHKPISTIVETNETDKLTIIKLGRKKICQKRLWRSGDLKRWGYDCGNCREYDKDKIDTMNTLKYAKKCLDNKKEV